MYVARTSNGFTNQSQIGTGNTRPWKYVKATHCKQPANKGKPRHHRSVFRFRHSQRLKAI